MQLEPRKQQLAHPVPPGRVDHVGLDLQVVAQEVGRVGVIGANPADLRGREYHVLRSFAGEELLDSRRVAQFQLGMRAQQQVPVSPALQFADDGRADQAPVASDVDPALFIHDGAAP